MNNLKEQIAQSKAKLKEVFEQLSSLPTNLSLPSEIYESWLNDTKYWESLEKTIHLLQARKNAEEVINQLLDAGRISTEKEKNATIPKRSPNSFEYNEIIMDFQIARELAVTSYVAATWSIYDRLSNICGRLAACPEISDNPKQNPKICEDFLGKKSYLGFSTRSHLNSAYSWPVKVSYTFRNWILHDGFVRDGVYLFKGDSIDNGLVLSDDAIAMLESLDILKDYKNNHCCQDDEHFPWFGNNLRDIFKNYHSEMDIMFVSLLQWSVDSFIAQIKAFAERDMFSLST